MCPSFFLNRLLTGDGNTCAYDAIGNIVKANGSTYAYNAGLAHSISSDGFNLYTYDTAGNMLSGPGRAISYDPENRK